MRADMESLANLLESVEEQDDDSEIIAAIERIGEEPDGCGDPTIVGESEEGDDERPIARDEFYDMRQDTHEERFEIAERWANKPDLSPTERCHGVVWEIYDHLNLEITDAKGHVVNTQANEYADLYDRKKTEDIKQGLILSAKDLFD